MDFYNISDKNYFVGKDISDFVISEQHTTLRDNFEELKTNGYKDIHEYKLIKGDGTTFYGEFNTNAFEGEDDGELNFITIVRDITPQKILLDELHNSQKMFQLVLDNIPQHIFWKDIESK